MTSLSAFEFEPSSPRAEAAARAERCPAPESAGRQPNSPAVAVRAAYHDPVWLIECAWSRLRLSSLQQLVGEVSADLSSIFRASEPPPAADLEAGGRDPAVEALEACRAELRVACAMRGAEADLERHGGLIRDYASARPSSWRTAFELAFDQYRRAASHALSRALSSPVVGG